MLRSRNYNVTAVDRAIYLWMLCAVEWMHERQEPISNNNLDRLFGETTRRRFNFYCEIAIDLHDLSPDSLQLTLKGKRIVDRWQKFSDLIFDVT